MSRGTKGFPFIPRLGRIAPIPFLPTACLALPILLCTQALIAGAGLMALNVSAEMYGPGQFASGGNVKVVEDGSAAGGKTAYLEQTKPGQETLVNIPTKPLPVGLYDITYHVKVAEGGNSVTPILRFEVHEPGQHRLVYESLTPYRVATPGAYQDYTCRVNHTAETPLQVVLISLSPVKASVDRVTVERSTQLRVASVWPGKTLYFRSDDAAGLVTVDNGTVVETTVRLVVDLVSGIDRTRKVHDARVTVPAGGRIEVPVKWNTGSEEFGFEMRATLLDEAGKPLDARGTCFSVSDNTWQVALMGADMPWDLEIPWLAPYPLDGKKIAEAEAPYAKALARPVVPNDTFWPYNNWREYYAWAPDDFFDLTPTRPVWWSGTGWYVVSRKALLASIELGHRMGVRQVTYAQPFAMGDRTYREVRVHPDWFLYGAGGQLCGGFDVRSLDLQRNPDYAARTVEDLQRNFNYTSAGLNFTKREVVDRGITELINSAKMFGWDGVRWDNTYYSINGASLDFDGNPLKACGDPQDLTIQVIRHFKERFRKDLGPRYAVGYNVEYTLHREAAPRAWDELPKGGCLMMDESIRSSHDKSAATNRWKEYAARINREGNFIRNLGGHSLIIGLDVQHPVDQLYQDIFTFAGRVHTYGAYRFFDLPYGNYAPFVTRYSALLFDIDKVKPLENVEEKIQVESEREVWWKDWATVRAAGPSPKQYLIHLINPPANEHLYADPTNAVPARQKNLRVSLASGEQVTAAWLLTAEPVTLARKLEVQAGNGRTTVTVPELAFWSVVVFEVK